MIRISACIASDAVCTTASKFITRVCQNHIYTVYIRYFWQGIHQIYGHIRCIYTVLANPICNLTPHSIARSPFSHLFYKQKTRFGVAPSWSSSPSLSSKSSIVSPSFHTCHPCAAHTFLTHFSRLESPDTFLTHVGFPALLRVPLTFDKSMNLRLAHMQTHT